MIKSTGRKGTSYISVLLIISTITWGDTLRDSQSDRSHNAQTSRQSDEIITARTQNSRSYKVKTTHTTIDPNTSEPCVNTREGQVIEVGTGICYKDQQGKWQPSRIQWNASANGFIIDKANYALKVGSTLGSWMEYSAHGHDLKARPTKIEIKGADKSATLGIVNSSAEAHIDSKDASKLIFKNAFAQGIDLEIQAGFAGYHQNVIFNSNISIPQELADQNDLQISVVTELDINDNLETIEIAAEKEPSRSFSTMTEFNAGRNNLIFQVKETNKEWFQFADSKIKDAGEKRNNESAAKKIIKTAEGKVYLVESLSQEYFQRAQYPIIWDYEIISSWNPDNNIWYANSTYYVSADLYVNSGTLLIEPGTIVKVADGKRIETTGTGSVLAIGKPLLPIIITSQNDTNVGEYIPGATSPERYDYEGLRLGNDSQVQFCRIQYASNGLYAKTGLLGAMIWHNIFSQCGTGIFIGSGVAGSSIANNLFTTSEYGIYLSGAGEYPQAVTIDNCTINGMSSAGITSTNYSNSIISNSVIANCTSGINLGFECGTQVNYCAFYGNTTNIQGNQVTTLTQIYDQIQYPFDTYNTYLGESYLNKDAGAGSVLINGGSTQISALNYYSDPLAWSIHHIPQERIISGEINNSIWQPQYDTCDSGIVAIGYHHPRIDYFVQGNSTVVAGNSLNVRAGTKIVKTDVIHIMFGANSHFSCKGLQSDDSAIDYVQWVDQSYGSASEVIYCDWEFQDSIRLQEGSSYEIWFTRFEGIGGLILESNNGCCRSSVFNLNHSYGIRYQDCLGYDCENCLFTNNAYGILDNSSSGSVESCTFSNNSVGIYISQGNIGTLIARNNLFHHDNYRVENWILGIVKEDNTGVVSESYNSFYGMNIELWVNNQRAPLNSNDYTYPLLQDDPLYNSINDYPTSYFECRYYLDDESPLVNGGYDPLNQGMPNFTTSIYFPDIAPIDVGYHYPLTIDTDSDGAFNYEEEWSGTSSSDPDSDNDGLEDGEEIHVYGSNPSDPDTDHDGMSDFYEVHNQLNIYVDDSGLMADTDQFTNLQESIHATSSQNPNEYPVSNIIIHVPADLPTIQKAIDASINADTIVLQQGTYAESIDLKGKNIIIQSEDPDDWSVVENTIIRGNGQQASIVEFDGTEASSCQLKGLTIKGYGIPSTDGLQAHWKFDGNTSDSTGQHPGVLAGGSSYGDGYINQGLNLNGTDGRVQITGYKGITGPYVRTCSAWIKTSVTGKPIISWGTTATGGKWVVRVNENGTLRAEINGGYIYGNTVLTYNNQWHHIAVVTDEQNATIGNVKLYVDGQLQTTTVYSSTLAINTGSGADVHIGVFMPSGQFFSGMIDDVRIYNVALTQEQIRYLSLSHRGIAGNGAQATIDRCIIKDNYSLSDGAGIYQFNGMINNCFITNNTSETNGGGLANCGANINSCTISNNNAIGATGGVWECTGVIRNTIVWGNLDSDLETTIEAAQISNCHTANISYCCIQDQIPLDGNVYLLGSEILDADPMFANSAVGDYRLLPVSFCIDAGDPSSPCVNEPDYNGGRINLGGYGNTADAAISLDDDGDHLGNVLEIRMGLDPSLVDTDGDGLVDGNSGIVSKSIYPAGVDSDEDGFVDGEYSIGTNPHIADTDLDGISDGQEVVQQSNPLIDDITGDPQPADGKQYVGINVVLSWIQGVSAAGSHVYFGTDEASVRDADLSSTSFYKGFFLEPSYAPEGLMYNQTYYWRVDEQDSTGKIRKRIVWSFRTTGIYVDPASIEVNLDPFEFTNQTVTIYNAGAANTMYTVSLREIGNTGGGENPISLCTGNSEDEIVLEYYFEQPIIQEGSEYSSITVYGTVPMAKPGCPELPVKVARILIPFGKEVESVEAEWMNRFTAECQHPIMPSQGPYSMEETGPIAFNFDPNTYALDTEWPIEDCNDQSTGIKCGYHIENVYLYPVKYVPSTGEICYTNSMRLTVHLADTEISPDDVANLKYTESIFSYLNEQIDNPSSVITYSYDNLVEYGLNSSPNTISLLPSGGPYKYVIITDEAYANLTGAWTLQALRDFHNARGLTATIVTTQYIYANYPGTRPQGGVDNETRIRNFITDAYRNWDTEYVLIGGGRAVVPARKFAVKLQLGTTYYTTDEGYTDSYYACLDTTFNYDGDILYGDDFFQDFDAEVYVGRALFSNTEGMNNFVRKTLSYNYNTTESLTKVVMVGEVLAFDIESKPDLQIIRNMFGTHNFGFDTSTNLYDEVGSDPWTTQDMCDVLNNGVHFVNHEGRLSRWTYSSFDGVGGTASECLKLMCNNLTALTSEQYFLLNSQQTIGGEFSGISESLQSHPYGAFALVMNSGRGWHNGIGQGPSHMIQKYFWQYVLDGTIRRIGREFYDSKEAFFNRYSSNPSNGLYYYTQLFADPALKLRVSQEPEWLQVNPMSGNVATGSSASLNVTIDATHLEPGAYMRNIVLTFNGAQEIIIPLTLNVIKQPEIPTQATNPIPSDDQLNVSSNIQLLWTPGTDALTHDLYFGTNLTSVEAADQEDPEYKGAVSDALYDNLGTLSNLQDYYWRVDEVGQIGTTKGQVWHFKTEANTWVNPNISIVRYYPTSAYSLASAGLTNRTGGNGLADCQVHFSVPGYSSSLSTPNLYIELVVSGGSASMVDTITCNVRSQSDQAGISAGFTETGVNTNTYRINSPIHLSSVSDNSSMQLKIMDEEHLYIDGVQGRKVDKGEVAAITADTFTSAWPQYVTDLGASLAHSCLYRGFVGNSTYSAYPGYGWSSNGLTLYQSNDAAFQSFMKNVGNTALSSADFLYECTHGSFGDLAGSGLKKPGGGNPSVAASDWEEDIEWAILYSCYVLGTKYYDSVYAPWGYDPDRWTGYWDDALMRLDNKNSCHGIMASSDTLTVCIGNVPVTSNHLWSFSNRLQNNEYVIDAFMDAAYQAEQWNASALFHYNNLDDTIRDVTPDTSDPTMFYTWFSGTRQQLTGWEGLAVELNPEPLLLENEGALVCVECIIPQEQPEIQLIEVQREEPDISPTLLNDFQHVGSNQTEGVHVLKKNRSKLSGRKALASFEESKKKADQFLKSSGGDVPHDAELADVIEQNVRVFDKATNTVKQDYSVSRIFEYRHKINGVEVAGGRHGNSIMVGIEDGGVSSLKRQWHQPQSAKGAFQKVIPATVALQAIFDALPVYTSAGGTSKTRHIVSQIKLKYVFEDGSETFHPAWAFKVGRFTWVYVDAFTGQAIN